jgi:hypothetical protein
MVFVTNGIMGLASKKLQKNDLEVLAYLVVKVP